MALTKIGSPQKINVTKSSSFVMDPNYLAQMLNTQWKDRNITQDQLHAGLKSIGVDSYSAEDMSILMERLLAIGFKISK